MSLFRGQHYYYQTSKSFITAFGSIFSDIVVEKNNADGTKAQSYEVPIDYAPKNKWLIMIQERPDYTTNQVQLTLPRLAFEITNMKPAMTRKIGFNGTYSCGNNLDGSRTRIYNPVPYDLVVNLYALSRDNEDMLQIVEQIIPFFQSTLVMNINLLPEYNIFKDIPISLMDVTTSDNYTGAVDEQRLVETSFTFNVPIYFFGPIANKQNIISEVIINMHGANGDPKETYDLKATTPQNIIGTWK
jgi:hypothetical protein